MRQNALCALALVAMAICASSAPARAEEPTGLDVPIGDASRSDQEYVWISNASNLPLFVERVYPGLEAARKALNVKVRIAGPTSVDLAAFITTVDAECTKNPAGVIVVGGWDDALASEVDKCIDKKVPTVVTDGDLPMSKRLTYLGTNWYNLGYQHGQYQCRYHAEAGLKSGEIGTISFLAASNFIAARQGLRDALAKECPDVTVVADEESGTNVEQVAANTAAIIQGHPDLTGMVGFDSEAGPGHRARRHRGRQGRPDHRHLERGRPRLPELDQGRHGEDDQHGEVRDDGLLRRLLPLHLPQRHHPQPRHGPLAAEPAAGDRRLGPDLRHRGQCRHHPRGDRSRIAAGDGARPGWTCRSAIRAAATRNTSGSATPRTCRCSSSASIRASSRRARRSTSRCASPARPRSISPPSSPPSTPSAPRTRPA